MLYVCSDSKYPPLGESNSSAAVVLPFNTGGSKGLGWREIEGGRGCVIDDSTQSRDACDSKFATLRVCHFGVSPKRRIDVPTGSGGEPSSPNCGASAGVKARQLLYLPQ